MVICVLELMVRDKLRPFIPDGEPLGGTGEEDLDEPFPRREPEPSSPDFEGPLPEMVGGGGAEGTDEGEPLVEAGGGGGGGT